MDVSSLAPFTALDVKESSAGPDRDVSSLAPFTALDVKESSAGPDRDVSSLALFTALEHRTIKIITLAPYRLTARAASCVPR